MYPQAVGFNPGRSVLSGLSGKGDAGSFAKGQAMAGAAGLNMEREQKNQQAGVEQMQADSQLRQRNNQNQSQRAGNEVQERVAQGDLTNRRNVFDTGMNFDYQALRKRQNMNIRQALLNQAVGEL